LPRRFARAATSLAQHHLKLLETKLEYSRQVNRKTHEGASHPDRNAQFEHINAKVIAAGRLASGHLRRYQEEGADRQLQERRLRLSAQGQPAACESA